MTKIIKIAVILFFVSLHLPKEASCQAIKTNIPFLAIGAPNIGAEFTISRKLSISGDIMKISYLYKTKEEVFNSLSGGVELRYYVNPKYYYTNNMYDGFYIGPYVLAGNYNVGFARNSDPSKNFRYHGRGVSAGASIGYKLHLADRFKLDFNICLGYAHLNHDKYHLGGENVNFPLEVKLTKQWLGPTKAGISLVYNLFK